MYTRGQEATERLAAIVAGSHDAIIGKDLHGVITSWNPAAVEIFGYAEEEALGKSTEFLLPLDRIHEEGLILYKLLRGERVSHFETERICKGGRRIVVSATVSPIFDPNGKVVGAYKIIRDITSQQKTQQALVIANKELAFQNEEKAKRVAELGIANIEKAKRAAELVIANIELAFQNEEKAKRVAELGIANEEKAKRAAELVIAKGVAEFALKVKAQFMSNISHEIRTPMNGIIGLTTLALNQTLSPQMENYLVGIESSAKSLLTILNNITDFSKLESGKIVLENTSFQLQDLFYNVQFLFEKSAKTKGLDLICLSKVDQTTPLMGDSFRIGQVINNLIDNAIKFTEKGAITFSVSLQEMENSNTVLRFSVKDTGMGISPETQKLILEPFTQADNSSTRRFGGAGLGLTICVQLLKVMGSNLVVTSAEGEGSSFSFDLVVGDQSC